jgi:DNA-binding beta-propeller fold protein YncE
MRTFILSACMLATAVVTACATGPSSSSTEPVGSAAAAKTKGPIQKVPQTANPYTLFETLQVRPLALSPNGKLLFAANTPDNRLEIFRVCEGSLTPVGSVEVGLEPVAVAARTDDEVWVVNHLSDSVSVVHVDEGGSSRVLRTLFVGDEPRDIVFAGPKHDRAFITTAHRGQTSPDDPDLFVSGGRADVWVFDANNLGTAAGGSRIAKFTFFADTPRALAATPDGKTVYAAAHFSGNQTTVVSEWAVSQVYPNGMPGPASILGGTVPQPTTALIVKYQNGHWVDAYGTVFDAYVRVNLPDKDVFVIDASQATPVATTTSFAHVGTTLFNMAVNPKSGKVYVSNTDAHNSVRFEGHTPGFTSVAGNIVDSRITVVDPASGALTFDNLNSHLDHAAGTGDPSLSVAFPQDLTVSRDGSKLFVVAQGSSKLAVYDTAQIEAGNGAPSAANQVALTGGGPTGVVLDEKDGFAFVLTRFDDGISVVDLGSKKETAHVALYNPESATVTAGRRFLYDATHTSALGDQACASCHVGGDNDYLAWDLGNPGGMPLPIAPNDDESVVRTIPESLVAGLIGQQAAAYIFHYYQPTKGPMTTQSLRGLDNHGAMHWRGDRNGKVQQSGAPFLDGNGQPVVSAQPNAGIFDELNGFKSFNVAFPGLIGNAAQLSDADMTSYADFALEITYPPNPVRNLDDSLTPLQAAGQQFYFNHAADGTELPVDRVHSCNGCHTLDRNGNAGATKHPGFFGTDGKLSFENETQTFKVPHLRNAYAKIGMFSSSLDQIHATASLVPQLNPQQDAVRGFGFNHDGTVASPEHFFSAVVFIQATATATIGGITAPPNPYGIPLFNDSTDPFNPASGVSTQGLELRRALSAFTLAFDSNLFPVVGQQLTLTASSGADAQTRLALFEAQAAAGKTDLVARGFVKGKDTGFVYSGGAWTGDRTGTSLTDAQLTALVGKGCDALTFTAVPPGEGWRVGVDRDGDGYADGDERAAGSNPADPTSTP